jgi:hypothetical protein
MSRISRRQLLTVAGLTVGAAWVELGVLSAPAEAAPSGGEVTIEPVADTPIPLLSAKGAAPQAIPRQLAVRVRGEGVALAAGTQVKVSFDRRLYSPLTAPLITLSGRRLAASASTAQDPRTGEIVCTLTLGEQAPAGTDLIALLGTADTHRYPYDLAVAPATVSAGISSHGRSAHRDLKHSRPSSFGGPAEPWGVEVGAGWEKLTWGPDGRYWYYYPVIATVTGSGPGRTPAAEFAVSVDPQVVTGISVASARLNRRGYATSKIKKVGTTVTGTLRQVHWRTDARLGADDQLDVILRVTTGSPAGPLETITHPVVSSGMASATAARRTGLTSVSRTDSSWQ